MPITQKPRFFPACGQDFLRSKRGYILHLVRFIEQLFSPFSTFFCQIRGNRKRSQKREPLSLDIKPGLINFTSFGQLRREERNERSSNSRSGCRNSLVVLYEREIAIQQHAYCE